MGNIRDPLCHTCNALDTAPDSLVIFRSEFWGVTLHPDQLYLGRVYVTLLDHIPEREDLSPEQVLGWHETLKRYRTMAQKAFGAAYITEATLMNNAYQHDPPHPHVHSHVRPRYREPFHLEGWNVTFGDPNFGHHHIHGEGNERLVPHDMLVAIAYKLRATEF